MKMKTQHTKTYRMELKQCLEGNLQLYTKTYKGERSQINILIFHLRILCKVLAGVAQWVGCHLTNQRVAGLIPGQGTCLGCGPGPWLGACKREPIDVSLTH